MNEENERETVKEVENMEKEDRKISKDEVNVLYSFSIFLVILDHSKSFYATGFCIHPFMQTFIHWRW